MATNSTGFDERYLTTVQTAPGNPYERMVRQFAKLCAEVEGANYRVTWRVSECIPELATDFLYLIGESTGSSFEEPEEWE